MNRSWWYRFSFLIVIVAVSVMTLIPTFTGMDTEKSNYPFKSKINLGLDLQGGLYMVLGIDFNKVYEDEVTNYIKKLETNLKSEEEIVTTAGSLIKSESFDPRYTLSVANVSDVEAVKDYVKKFYVSSLRLTAEDGGVLEYALANSFKTEIEENSVKKSIEVIRNRIDEFGVTEPEIVSLGSERIVVQLPGVKDIERAKELIGKTAKLEFKMVHDTLAFSGAGLPAELEKLMADAKAAGIEHKRGQRFSDYVAKMNEFYKEMPKGYELAFEKKLNPVSNELDALYPYLIESSTKLTGEGLQDAVVRTSPDDNRPYVALTFKTAGAKAFEELTGENINRRMAIVLDGNVYSAPVIQARIGGGNAQITLGAGNYDTLLVEARDLALVLRAGALPVELEFEEQRIVGPSLGADSIEKSEIAGLIASGLVFLFILFYYKVSGLIAIKTLTFNVIFVLACLVGIEATLTLPGIAGIALTVGMAVDANIIIYERIKEELRRNTPVREAVQTGFAKAFWTILDANLTTAVAGLMLLNFGTGPIRGFAVTLVIGIASTVYTAYFVSKIYFELYMNRTEGKKISI